MMKISTMCPNNCNALTHSDRLMEPNLGAILFKPLTVVGFKNINVDFA